MQGPIIMVQAVLYWANPPISLLIIEAPAFILEGLRQWAKQVTLWQDIKQSL